MSNEARDALRQDRRKHGYKQLRRTCSCELCKAYERGYKAGAMSKNSKRSQDNMYDDDDIMKDLLP